jgi:hypothetical protein
MVGLSVDTFSTPTFKGSHVARRTVSSIYSFKVKSAGSRSRSPGKLTCPSQVALAVEPVYGIQNTVLALAVESGEPVLLTNWGASNSREVPAAALA